MKLTPYLTHSYLIPAFALMSLPLAHATDFVWDGATTGTGIQTPHRTTLAPLPLVVVTR